MSHTQKDKNLRIPKGFLINLGICLGYAVLWVMTLLPRPGDEQDIIGLGIILTAWGIWMPLRAETLTWRVKTATLVARVAIPVSFLTFTVDTWYWSMSRMFVALVVLVISMLTFTAQYVAPVPEQEG